MIKKNICKENVDVDVTYIVFVVILIVGQFDHPIGTLHR